eukprot:scaffold351_cov162-Ochromonas_danica.AAC.18
MKWIARLCCCSCINGSAKIKEKKKTRGDLRRELLEQQRPLMDQSLLYDMPLGDEEGESRDFLEAERRDKASRSIQSIVRGFLARQRFLSLWMEAIEEADKYWLYQYWLQAEEERLRRLRARARKEFVKRYIGQGVEVAVATVVAMDEACLTIQRTWRGHRARMHLPRRPPPPKKRLVKKILPGRLSAETLRRVWARELFEPSDQPYLHNTDFGYDRFDMWEYADQPPEGRDHGLVTRKVVAHAQSDRGQRILARDPHAWVGLPISMERKGPPGWQEMMRQSRATSPYAQPPFNLSSSSALEEASSPQSPFEQDQQGMFHPARVAGTPVRRMLERLGYDPQEEFSLRPSELLAMMGGRSPAVAKQASLRAPRVGDLRYDPESGHLLVYRRALDGLHWRKARGGEKVEPRGPLDDIPPLPLARLPPLLSDPLASAQGLSIGSRLMPSMRSNPIVRHLRSGYVQVKTSSSSPSALERQQAHKQAFLASASQSLHENEDLVPAQGLETTSFLTDPGLLHSAGDQGMTEHSVAGSLASGPWQEGTSSFAFTAAGTPIRGGRKTRPLAQTFKSEQQLGLSASQTAYQQRIRSGVVHLQAALRSSEAEKVMEEVRKRDGDVSVWQAFERTLQDRERHRLSSLQLGYSDSFDFEEAVAQDLWSRSLYQPAKEAVSKLALRPRQRSAHYRLQYTWIPQPLVHNAVNNIYLTKHAYRSALQTRSLLRGSSAYSTEDNAMAAKSVYSRDIQKEIYTSSARLALRQERDQMATIVTEDLHLPPRERDSPDRERSMADLVPETSSVYLADLFSPMRYYYDEGSEGGANGSKEVYKDDDSSSLLSPVSTRHPERQHPQELTMLRPRVFFAEQQSQAQPIVEGRVRDDDSLTMSTATPSLTLFSLSTSAAPPAMALSTGDDVSGLRLVTEKSSALLSTQAPAFSSFISSVPPGRLPDTTSWKNSVRSTYSVDELLQSGSFQTMPTGSMAEDSREVAGIKTKGGGASRKFRFPAVNRKKPRDDSVHPYEWH